MPRVVTVNQQVVVQLIRDTWADARYPGDDKIADDTSGYHLECNQVAAFFRGKDWHEITLRELARYDGDGSACLSFMSPSAFRYYLPAYMLIALEDYSDADVAAYSAIHCLNPQLNTSLADFKAKRFELFSADERQAIVAFLSFMQREHGQECYWYGLKDTLSYWEGGT